MTCCDLCPPPPVVSAKVTERRAILVPISGARERWGEGRSAGSRWAPEEGSKGQHPAARLDRLLGATRKGVRPLQGAGEGDFSGSKGSSPGWGWTGGWGCPCAQEDFSLKKNVRRLRRRPDGMSHRGVRPTPPPFQTPPSSLPIHPWGCPVDMAVSELSLFSGQRPPG